MSDNVCSVPVESVVCPQCSGSGKLRQEFYPMPVWAPCPGCIPAAKN